MVIAKEGAANADAAPAVSVVPTTTCYTSKQGHQFQIGDHVFRWIYGNTLCMWMITMGSFPPPKNVLYGTIKICKHATAQRQLTCSNS